MNLIYDLERLGRLRKDGTLSEGEFTLAKAMVLNQPDDGEPASPANPFCEAFNRNKTARKMTAVVVVIIFLIIFEYLRAYSK
jgi:hypothetical protein